MINNKALKLGAALVLIITCVPAQGQQTCNSQMAETAPASRFTVNANQTVTDLATGLIWKQCAQGLSGAGCSTGTATDLDWESALAAAQTENFAGQTDWRLPNVKELLSIIEFACNGPAINIEIFPNTQSSSVWSASPSNFDKSWIVGFNFGGARNFVFSRNDPFGVRLVRGGQ